MVQTMWLDANYMQKKFVTSKLAMKATAAMGSVLYHKQTTHLHTPIYIHHVTALRHDGTNGQSVVFQLLQRP